METINRLNNSLLVQPVMTLQHFVDTLWRDYLNQHGVKPSTIYSYDSMLTNLVLPNFGQKTVDQITPVRLSQLFQSRAREEVQLKILAERLLAAEGDVRGCARVRPDRGESDTAEAASAQSRAEREAELHPRATTFAREIHTARTQTSDVYGGSLGTSAREVVSFVLDEFVRANLGDPPKPMEGQVAANAKDACESGKHYVAKRTS
jgi:hypothetical protein